MTALSMTGPARVVEHFHHLSEADRAHLFFAGPQPLDLTAERETVAAALGATLYMPADREDLAATVARRAGEGICSMVLDLEDAIDEANVEAAALNAVNALDELAAEGLAATAMVFVRVRSEACIERIVGKLSVGAQALAGFVVPKFSAATGERYLRQVIEAAETLGKHLYCMPVLESAQILYRESRDHELAAISEILNRYRETVLAVRVGATDMCGMYGIRRDRDHTIYDVKTVADTIADIVNRLARNDGTGFVVTAPVWEYFADHERLFRPLLRTTPFAEHDAVRFRSSLVSRDLDGLLREISLDRANGLLGKTVIHPTHVAAVHALSVVTHEEYRDATDVMAAAEGGVRRSEYRNKMNEPRPHRIWAEQVLRRARVFGVANEGVTFVDFLTVLAAQ